MKGVLDLRHRVLILLQHAHAQGDGAQGLAIGTGCHYIAAGTVSIHLLDEPGAVFHAHPEAVGGIDAVDHLLHSQRSALVLAASGSGQGERTDNRVLDELGDAVGGLAVGVPGSDQRGGVELLDAVHQRVDIVDQLGLTGRQQERMKRIEDQPLALVMADVLLDLAQQLNDRTKRVLPPHDSFGVFHQDQLVAGQVLLQADAHGLSLQDHILDAVIGDHDAHFVILDAAEEELQRHGGSTGLGRSANQVNTIGKEPANRRVQQVQAGTDSRV